jgi:16S rRNA (cytosine1402-N4)-methyltransferase
VTTAKNGLLAPLQRRLLRADRNGALLQPPLELAELVAGAVKTREPGQNPATRTFQALRIFINAELEELEQALEAACMCCNPEVGSW